MATSTEIEALNKNEILSDKIKYAVAVNRVDTGNVTTLTPDSNAERKNVHANSIIAYVLKCDENQNNMKLFVDCVTAGIVIELNRSKDKHVNISAQSYLYKRKDDKIFLARDFGSYCTPFNTTITVFNESSILHSGMLGGVTIRSIDGIIPPELEQVAKEMKLITFWETEDKKIGVLQHPAVQNILPSNNDPPKYLTGYTCVKQRWNNPYECPFIERSVWDTLLGKNINLPKIAAYTTLKDVIETCKGKGVFPEIKDNSSDENEDSDEENDYNIACLKPCLLTNRVKNKTINKPNSLLNWKNYVVSTAINQLGLEAFAKLTIATKKANKFIDRDISLPYKPKSEDWVSSVIRDIISNVIINIGEGDDFWKKIEETWTKYETILGKFSDLNLDGIRQESVLGLMAISITANKFCAFLLSRSIYDLLCGENFEIKRAVKQHIHEKARIYDQKGSSYMNKRSGYCRSIYFSQDEIKNLKTTFFEYGSNVEMCINYIVYFITHILDTMCVSKYLHKFKKACIADPFVFDLAYDCLVHELDEKSKSTDDDIILAAKIKEQFSSQRNDVCNVLNNLQKRVKEAFTVFDKGFKSFNDNNTWCTFGTCLKKRDSNLSTDIYIKWMSNIDYLEDILQEIDITPTKQK